MSAACQQLTDQAALGAAPALRAVDCLANETAAGAFGRLMGPGGALLPALTIVLTLYIAFFAISLLTGRSRLGISALTPRALQLGLVLTFATSWIAYQGVVWNLAVGAPDELATVMSGTSGSATGLFANKLDMVFAAIAQANDAVGGAGVKAAGQAAQGAFTPQSLMWLAAILLLLGTVGVLVTARIALAVLLAVGPVFVIFALFPGTRGLFTGWLRGVVMTAIVPLFVVVGGTVMLELLVPILSRLLNQGGVIDGQAAMALFLVAAVHCALMAMIVRVTNTMVSAWHVLGGKRERHELRDTVASGVPQAGLVQPATVPEARTASGRQRVYTPVIPANDPGDMPTAEPPRTIRERTVAIPALAGGPPSPPPLQPRRARGVGSRYRAQPNLELMR